MLTVISLATTTLNAQERWIDAYRDHRFDQALALSDRDIQQLPRDPKTWTERAMTLAALKRNEESIISFQRALKLHPRYLPALKGAAELTYQNHDPLARDFINGLLQIDPKNSTAHAMAGVLAFERRDCGAAAQHFEQSGPELESNQQAYSFYGACLLKLGKAQAAVTIFTSLLERVPQNPNVRYNLGYAQLSAGNAAEAVTTLRPLTSGERPDPAALNLFASAEAANGDLPAALQDLRKAVHLKPDAEENYLDFASLCLEHNSPDLAAEIMDIGIQNVPNSARLYSMRGIVNAQRNKSEESVSDFEQADRLSPEKSYGAVGLSMLYAKSDHPADAERILRQKLKATPNDPTLNYLLADLLVNQKKETGPASLAEANASLVRSLVARPHFSNAHALLGKVLRRTGDNAKAIQQFKLALADNPENRVALNQIVGLLRAAGREQEAVNYSTMLRKLLEHELKDEVSQSRSRIVIAQ